TASVRAARGPIPDFRPYSESDSPLPLFTASWTRSRKLSEFNSPLDESAVTEESTIQRCHAPCQAAAFPPMSFRSAFSAPRLLINCTRTSLPFYAVLRKSGYAKATIFNEGHVHPRRSIADSSRAARATSLSVLG